MSLVVSYHIALCVCKSFWLCCGLFAVCCVLGVSLWAWENLALLFCAVLAARLSEAICLRPSWKFKEEGRRKGRVGLWIWLELESISGAAQLQRQRQMREIAPKSPPHPSFSVSLYGLFCGLPTRLVALPIIKILVVSRSSRRSRREA